MKIASVDFKNYILNKFAPQIETAREMYENCDAEHTFAHIKDVVFNLFKLYEIFKENNPKMFRKIDWECCALSAFWHDVGRSVSNAGHEEISAHLLKTHLLSAGFESKFAKKCFQAIVNHKSSATPKTIEGLIVKDCDKAAFAGKYRWVEMLKQNNISVDLITKGIPTMPHRLYFEESKMLYRKDAKQIEQMLSTIIGKADPKTREKLTVAKKENEDERLSSQIQYYSLELINNNKKYKPILSKIVNINKKI